MSLGLDWLRSVNSVELNSGREAEQDARNKFLLEANALAFLNTRERTADNDDKPRKETLKLDTGRSLEFNIDANGKVSQLTIDGNRIFTRQGNSDTWDVSDNGNRSFWYGNIELNKDGSYTYQVRGDQTKITTKKNGNIITTRGDGSSVETNNDLTLKIVMPNSKSMTFERDKGKLISVTESDGTVWKRDGNSDKFVSDKSKEPRTGVDVTKEGDYSYTEKSGIRHTINRVGKETITYSDNSSIEKNSLGLVEKVKRTSGTTVDCKYDDQNRLLSVTIGGATTYSRKDGASTDWTYSSNGTTEKWAGAIQVRPDGTCVYSKLDTRTNEFVQRNGKRWVEGADKSRVDLNADGYPTLLTRADGTTVECEYQNGKLSKFTEMVGSSKVVWEKKAGTERWFSNSYPGYQKIDLAVSKEGVVTYSNVAGTKYTIGTDNGQTRVKDDGTKSVLNAKQQAESVQYPNGLELTCKWTGNTLTRIEEKKGGKSTVWDKDPAADIWTSQTRPGETLRNVTLDDDAYTFVHLKDDVTIDVRYFDGATRTFERDKNNELSKVTESTRGGNVTTWTRQAGTDKWSDGFSTEERQTVGVNVSGKYEFTHTNGQRQIFKLDGTEDVQRRKRTVPEEVERSGVKLWNELYKQVTDPKERNSFRLDMEAFNKRAAVNGITDDQIVKTFDTITALLQQDDKTSQVKKEERVELAKQLMRHVAHPRAIDQGYHGTCNVATIQVVLAAKQPEKFVDVVKQVAITGEYRTPGNTVIKLDANSMKPDWQARYYKPYDPARNTGGRSFASQLFNVTAVNTFYTTQGYNRRYEQRAPEGPEDTGERLFDTTSGAEVERSPGLTTANMSEVSRQITGNRIPIFQTNEMADANVTQVASSADLKTKLEDLQKTGKLPAIIMVNCVQEPYFSETGKGRSGKPPGWHVVTVWNVDSTGQVLVDNQWGRKNDREGLRRMAMSTLFQSMRK